MNLSEPLRVGLIGCGKTCPAYFKGSSQFDVIKIAACADLRLEQGYSLEVFNAVGESLAVVTVSESQIEPLTNNEIMHVRRLDEVSL